MLGRNNKAQHASPPPHPSQLNAGSGHKSGVKPTAPSRVTGVSSKQQNKEDNTQEWGDFHRNYHSNKYSFNARNSALMKRIRKGFWSNY